MLPADIARCQGAIGLLGNGLTAGAMPAECCACRRRTDMQPDATYRWMEVPTFLWVCPERIGPEEYVAEENC